MKKTYTWQESTTIDFDDIVDCMKERADRFFDSDNALYGLAADALTLCCNDEYYLPADIEEQILNEAVRLYKEAR